MSNRVLLTGAGQGRANNLARSLQAGGSDIHTLGCHFDRFMLAKSDTDHGFVVPHPSANDYPVEIAKIIEDQHVDLIIPTNDEDTLAIARVRDALPCCVYLPSTELISLCQDKYELGERLRNAGIAMPKAFPVSCRQDVFDAFDRLGNPPLMWCRTREGFASRGATKVQNGQQAWNWITYWNELRGLDIKEFTISEFLPGRDFNVQGLWHQGEPILLRMCERLSYLGGGHNPSGMSSTPAVAKTLRDDPTLDICEQALHVLDHCINGIFSIDMKQDRNGISNITEINAGRFAMITNFYDLVGGHNMAHLYVDLALNRPVHVPDNRNYAKDHYLIRDQDTLPSIVEMDELPL